MSFKCTYCSRTYSSPYGLKRHISSKHQYIINDNEEAPTQTKIVEESGLWDDDEDEEASTSAKIAEESGLWDEDFIMNYSEVIISIVIIAKNN